MVAVEVYLHTATIVVFRIVADNQDLANKKSMVSSSSKRSFDWKVLGTFFLKGAKKTLPTRGQKN